MLIFKRCRKQFCIENVDLYIHLFTYVCLFNDAVRGSESITSIFSTINEQGIRRNVERRGRKSVRYDK
jgi:hypothetical protein